VAAEKHGLVSAAYYFVGTEAAIQGVRPSHWNSFDASVPGSDRVARVVEWLQWPQERRPRLITLYFEHVDTVGHDFGRGSPELAQAVAEVDANIGRLLDAIAELGLAGEVNVLVVSDHGQANYVDPERSFVLREHVDLAGLEIISGGAYAWIYQQQPDREEALAIRDAINENWSHGRAVLRDEAPAEWRVTDSPRYPEIFVVPDVGYGVIVEREGLAWMTKADHGWEPSDQAMHGIFLGTGPGLPVGMTIGEISAVNIYPLMLDLLRIEAPPPPPDRDRLRSMLRGEDRSAGRTPTLR
jgi:predicted AlkP superfamily pyrophosphatase or phosphodiesterase